MTTITAPTKAELAAEVAQLRYELDALRDGLADEVRTRRLVVIDRDGAERIATAVAPHSTMIHVEWGDPTTREWASTTLCAGAGPGDGETAEAIVNTSTGDDKYALLWQRSYDDGRTRSAVDLLVGQDATTIHEDGAL